MFWRTLDGVAKGRQATRRSRKDGNDSRAAQRKIYSRKNFSLRIECSAARSVSGWLARYCGAQNAMRAVSQPASSMRAISTGSCSVRVLNPTLSIDNISYTGALPIEQMVLGNAAANDMPSIT